ncbi:hypothetical protein G4G28_10405 [Massilia sp. Dwa41.01b]|uniref:hypothetical protein n=1 Tax=Massilia sp. Dwa41.01b TaxID=2709302 RepID=UPI001602EC47|nr:hypothetical protein [Massilia sp. Dwa41.01b]QNA87219.1 hypothetical protein G4G28_10405 [Massilia sp. Dwa41.01b]
MIRHRLSSFLPGRRAPGMRLAGWLLACAAAACAAAAVVPIPVLAQSAGSLALERRVKAAFLYKFWAMPSFRRVPLPTRARR